MALPQIFFTTMEKALNYYLRLSDDYLERLQSFVGKNIAIHLKGIEITFYLSFAENRICVLSEINGEADTTLSGTPFALAKMAFTPLSPNSATLFSNDLEISGDTHLGQEVKQFLDELNIDWEEHLSRVIGDAPARVIANAARGGINWLKQTANYFQQNITEYIQEEQHYVPPFEAIEDLYCDTEKLLMDVERLEARINRLFQHLQ